MSNGTGQTYIIPCNSSREQHLSKVDCFSWPANGLLCTFHQISRLLRPSKRRTMGSWRTQRSSHGIRHLNHSMCMSFQRVPLSDPWILCGTPILIVQKKQNANYQCIISHCILCNVSFINPQNTPRGFLETMEDILFCEFKNLCWPGKGCQ